MIGRRKLQQVVPAPRQELIEVGHLYRAERVAYEVEALTWGSGQQVPVTRMVNGEQVTIPQQVRYQLASVKVLDVEHLAPTGELRMIRADVLLPSRGAFERVAR